jgi:hypothetical protein
MRGAFVLVLVDADADAYLVSYNLRETPKDFCPELTGSVLV